MDVQPQGVHAPGIDEEHIEPEILPVASLLGPRTHNLLHDPPMPWCDICTQAKGRDACHTQARSKVLPVTQFDFAVFGARPGEPHCDLMVSNRHEPRRNLGVSCADQRKGGSIPRCFDSPMVVRVRAFKNHQAVRW